MPLRWIETHKLRYELIGSGADARVVEHDEGQRQRSTTKNGARLLASFRALKHDDDGRSVHRFSGRYGGLHRVASVAAIRELAKRTDALIRLAEAVRSGPAYQPSEFVDERNVLVAWLNEEGGVAAEVQAGSLLVRLDLSKYPRDRWRSTDGEHDVLPGPSFATLSPAPEDPHSYAVPLEVDVAGPSAVAAWIRGDQEWIGSRPPPSREYWRAADGRLVAELVRHTWGTYLAEQSRFFRWEQNRFTWDDHVSGVIDALAHEVLRAVTEQTLGLCRKCGRRFPKQRGRAGGRPRSECDRCYDPNLPRRRAARRATRRGRNGK